MGGIDWGESVAPGVAPDGWKGAGEVEDLGGAECVSGGGPEGAGAQEAEGAQLVVHSAGADQVAGAQGVQQVVGIVQSDGVGEDARGRHEEVRGAELAQAFETGWALGDDAGIDGMMDHLVRDGEAQLLHANFAADDDDAGRGGRPLIAQDPADPRGSRAELGSKSDLAHHPDDVCGNVTGAGVP